MTICFDLRALQIGHEKRGIGMYARSLLENLPVDSGYKYLFYAFDKNDPIKELGIKFKNDYELIQTKTIKTAVNSPSDILGFLRLINHRFAPLKSKKPDVFVQFDFTLGIPKWRSTKSIVIGYDLIPLIKKNEYLPSVSLALKQSFSHSRRSPASLLRSIIYRVSHLSFRFKRPRFIPKTLVAITRSMYYRFKYRQHYKTFKQADQIICISKATANDFEKILGIDKNKIHPIPLAPVFSSTKPDKSITKALKKPYIMYIGGTDSRKRIQDIVYAFNIAKGRGADIQLVLAGNEFRKAEDVPSTEGRNAILESSYKDDIFLLGFVSDAEKLALYRSALAFVFCSSYEGFGLPIVEAMSASCPVISYNNSSIPEAAGEAALLVETGDYVAVANKIIQLENEQLREELVKKGLKQAQKFNWEDYVTSFLAVLKRR